MRQLLFIILAFVALNAAAQRTIENPTTEFSAYGDGYFFHAVDVTKVELKQSETVVYLTVKQRGDMWFKFTNDSYLKVDDRQYKVLSAEGIELGKEMFTMNGKSDFAMHFEPLPIDTKSFDLIDNDGFNITGIKAAEERWKQLVPSYWRDAKSGNWELALCEEFAIYQCKFWDYKQRDINEKKGTAEIVLTNGNDELKISVGKDKNGSRTMKIGGKKVVYSMITSRFMPEYPVKDTRTEFVDNGYKTDSVTVVGWVKDMPEFFKDINTFDFFRTNFYTFAEERFSADLDEKGRFEVKIPVQNSSAFYCDWKRCYLQTVLEPGKTYFLLYDWKEGRRYFMGDDCRLQNEIFKYPISWEDLTMEDGGNFDTYIAECDSFIKAQTAEIDNISKENSLSTRFNIYQKGAILAKQANAFGQAQFHVHDYKFTENARKYAYDTFWTKLPKPYTLYRETFSFWGNYIGDYKHNTSISSKVKWEDHISEIANNEEEIEFLTQWSELVNEGQAKIDAEANMEEKMRIANEFNAQNQANISRVESIMTNGAKARKFFNKAHIDSEIEITQHLLDSLNADQVMKDVMIGLIYLETIDHTHTSVSAEAMDKLRALVKRQECVKAVEAVNDRYIAIENREFDKAVLKRADNLQGISEGKELIDKIIEPYRGKIVLLDIWGTWCAPCKMLLSKSQEEYARLKDFDVQYLYLANSSPQDSWENVIKEYNVSGDNVAHYNLPKEQQAAIERYLNVHAFPTYKIFDREGRLLDVEVNGWDHEGLASLIEKL